jgi:DNA-binding transcriptional ArsR family regulator
MAKKLSKNANKILREITATKDELPVNVIADKTALSYPTVLKYVKFLSEENLIVKRKKGKGYVYSSALKEREEKYKEARERYEKKLEEPRKKRKIKVKKIIKREDYWARCQICNRQLKKGLVTDQGTLGYRCYLTEIGIPPRGPRLRLKDLPDEAFEGVMEDIIKQVQKLDPLKKIDIATDGTRLKYPARFASHDHVEFYRENGTGWTGGRIMDKQLVIARLLDIDYQIVQRAFRTKTFENYWRQQNIFARGKNYGGPINESKLKFNQEIARKTGYKFTIEKGFYR